MHPSPIPDRATPESVYAGKYEWLLRWAMHFCGNDRNEAEDLVQDVFLQLLVSWTSIRDLERPEKFLYTYLKYAYLLKRRRNRRYSFQTLSAIDFESFHLSLRHEKHSDPVELQDGLRRVLAYLNWRRLSAKSASILLLRFFHGFYPSEIMQIGMLARKSVDNGLAQAREEVKAYLLDAKCLQVVNRGAPPILAPLHIAIPAAEFEQELCDTIFQARSGDCLPPELLRKRYNERTGISIECELLAHIVSCRKCLDLVCRWTNLPTYSHRSPYEASGLAQRDKGKRIPIAMPPKADPHVSMRTGQNRFREMYEHRPRVLMIAVDGEVLAARDVSSESCELKVEMNRGVPTELIEILSEQELPLLTVPISSLPPEAPPTIYRKNTLDAGRKVELLVRFTPTGALLEVTYNDPQYAPVPRSVPGDHFTEPAPARTKWRAKRSDEEGGTSSLLRRCAKVVHELAKPSRHRIIAAAAAIAILLLVGSVIFKYSSARLRPDELLQRSVTAEYAPSPNLVGIVHQKIAITTPHRGLERNVYRDIKRHVHPRNKPLTSQDVGLEAALASADVSWNDPLSPATFEEWRNHETIARDIIKRDANHLVTLTTVAQRHYRRGVPHDA